MNASHGKRICSSLGILTGFKSKQHLISLLSWFGLTVFGSTPAIAAGEVLGVVKSQDNAQQWAAITKRLAKVGVEYCIVEAELWQQELDLGNIQVLLLPNIETFNSSQTSVLQTWMDEGGKVIATGPIGNLSQPKIRVQLRSLLGAYWSQPMTSPTSLQLSQNTPVEWYGRTHLESTLAGATIIPTGDNSKTAATWQGESQHPAAIVTSNSTFLGWRWGNDVDEVFDSSWLQAALNRYGINTYGTLTEVAYAQPIPCRSSTNPQNEPQPSTPLIQIERTEVPLSASNQISANLRSQNSLSTPLQSEITEASPVEIDNPEGNLRPLDKTQPLLPDWRFENQKSPLLERNGSSGSRLTAAEIQTMTQQLQGLISRFESTLLTADANESDISLSSTEVIEQLLAQRLQNSKQGSKKLTRLQNRDSHQALQKAKTQLDKFLELVEQNNYVQAQNQWLEVKNTLWDSYPVDRPVAPSEVRAMWLDRGTIVKARSEDDLVTIFNRMAKAGINTVFFETVNSGYTIYPSRIAPQQNPLVAGWDPLQAAVKLAKERDMELHAWVWVFATVNQRHNTILNLPENYPGPILSRYPDWGITDQKGNSFHYHSGKAFLDPANPKVQRYLSLLLEEIATDYDVDGIHLDYIRYPFQSPTGKHNYGYGTVSRQKFRQMTGVDPIELNVGDKLWSQWTGFRLKQVDNFVSTVSQRLKSQRPDLILSTAVFPMPRQERLQKIQQHWEKWVREGSIDLLVPMTYASDTDELYQLTRTLFNHFNEEQALLLPGIRLLNIPDIVAVDQIQLLRGMPTEGFALFAAENFNFSLERIMRRTHNNLSKTAEPLPYRQPFAAALSRYQNLQKEWNYFIVNNQVAIDDLTLKEWGSRADELALNLEKLAQEPSKKHLSLAQMSLSSFRRKFPRWIADNKTISPYQTKVWNNRLETLDRLLNYGERTELSIEN